MGPSAFWAALLAFQPIVTAAAYMVPPVRNHSHSKTGLRAGELPMFDGSRPQPVNSQGKCLMPLIKPGQQPVWLSGRADAGRPVQQLAQQHGDFPAGQVRAEAEMRPGAAEADVRVRRPGPDGGATAGR
jgi:hypothetical protein